MPSVILQIPLHLTSLDLSSDHLSPEIRKLYFEARKVTRHRETAAMRLLSLRAATLKHR
jgi:hypothetical protein